MGSEAQKIRVMLSSRCQTEARFADGVESLTALRVRVKEIVESARLGGRSGFSVWINEKAPAAPLEETSWSRCVDEARAADVFVSIDANDAGWWHVDKPGAGICHAELQAAVESGRGKVRIVGLASSVPPKHKSSKAKAMWQQRLDLMQAYKRSEGIDGFQTVLSADMTLEAAAQTVASVIADACIDLVKRGRTLERARKLAGGEALKWARYDLDQRAAKIKTTLEALCCGWPAIRSSAYALPEVYSSTWAREILARPFLEPGAQVGALLFVGCYKGFSESQARSLFGHSALMTVPLDFGLYVRDLRFHSQAVFLKNCRDGAALSARFQSARAWLESIEDDVLLTSKKRAQIEKLMGTLGRADKE